MKFLKSRSAKMLVNLATTCAIFVFQTKAQALKIMVVNDDGYQAEGIAVLFDTLQAAGHEVTIVAPKQDQSGIGTSINASRILQPTEVVNYDTHRWYVDATPTVTTWAGLDYILKDNKPDLVVSGINQGENVGLFAVSSGTVSAAVAALNRGVPAIAISAGINQAESATGYRSTRQAYKTGANFIVALLKELEAKKKPNSTILPPGIGLNINIPVRFPDGISTIQGVALTRFDSITPFDVTFGELPTGTGVGLKFEPVNLSSNTTSNPDSEGSQFLSGFITVTPIDGDWSSLTYKDWAQLRHQLPLLPSVTPKLLSVPGTP
ncbi:5'/3'-nucleotidase SurE [Scytonema sp. UIC 10036]|uniref:5'/3'-nucleotidase SurE n=1 Tax=Scytonema sp. UIC 10036 TaxID=2304196 RepID=UPI0012DA79C4|nr:5'/3'-nucleotidase SurE [Scytonema sp. UIC 10036]MUG94277.1 5'/3'-nucleotidase SurE [Scytonema sp. UIC 10036]